MILRISLHSVGNKENWSFMLFLFSFFIYLLILIIYTNNNMTELISLLPDYFGLF